MDGLSEAYWNADQLLVWVWCRDRDLVRRAADGFTDFGTYSQELKLPDGRVVMAETPGCWMGLSSLSLLADMRPRRNLSEIRAEVLNVLREGRLHALGLENGEGNLKEIADGQWAGLSFYEDRDYRTYASPDDHFRPGATKWHGLKFKRAEVLGIWPDPKVITAHPLEPLPDDRLDALLKLDTWTLTEALYVLQGYAPLGYESIDQLRSHFPDAYHLAYNSILSGSLCREIKIAGDRVFIESPARWFEWAIEKGLPVADIVRAKMAPVGKDSARRNTWPQGARSFERADAPLLEEMAAMMKEDDSLSPWAAAGKVASKAKGGGTVESRQKRLANRYRSKLSADKF